MRIVLDTGAFFRPEAIRQAQGRFEDVVVPAIAYAERLRQVEAHGPGPARAFRAAMAHLVEPFGAAEAERFVPGFADLPRRQWIHLARDAMIAGHVRAGDELWTTDPDDFAAVGVPGRQIVGF